MSGTKSPPSGASPSKMALAELKLSSKPLVDMYFKGASLI